jgi:HEAT repeat protein
MMRLLCRAVLLCAPLAVWSCAGSPEDDRSERVLERAAFLFRHYGDAQKNQDSQMLTVLRADLRKLNVEGIDVLIRLLGEGSQEAQGYAAFALGFSANRAAIAPLTKATESPEETVRGNAIAALGQLGFSDAPIEPFRRLLKDPIPEVRQAALFGLSWMVDPKVDGGILGDVLACLSDPDMHVRSEALIVLRKMRRKESVTPILAGPVKDSEPLVRAAAAMALGAMGRDAQEATPFLVEMLKDEQHCVVDGAWTALNRIHDKDLDRSYSTWRDWYEDEQRIHYTCLEHREISEIAPGVCPKCGKRLERMSREGLRKAEAPPGAASGLFTCPEHREIVTTTPSRCGVPGCGRELVPKRPDPVVYTCPEHHQIVTTTPSKCGVPGCGKDLIPRKP